MDGIRSFLRQLGERWLKSVDFNYWCILFHIRKWQHSPFPTPKGEMWNY